MRKNRMGGARIRGAVSDSHKTDQPHMNSWQLITCPQCRASAGHRLRWSGRNISALAANGFVIFVNIALFGLGLAGGILLLDFLPLVGLERVCLSCGFRFVDKKARRPDYDRCADCGYDLTGNVSGRCSECGWRMPLRYRAWRRKMDRAKG